MCRARQREIETHLVGCARFAEYMKQSANDEVYAFVEKKVQEFGSPSAANVHLTRARTSRDNQLWGRAYNDLCYAYRSLGQSGR